MGGSSIRLIDVIRFKTALAGTLWVTAGGLAQQTEVHRYDLEVSGSGHLLISAEIAGRGPYRFALDTGASRTGIARAIAEVIGYQATDVDRNIQALTNNFQAARFELEHVRVNGVELGDVQAVVLPSDDPPLPVVGYFATDAFGANRYTIDFVERAFITGSAPPAHADGQYDADRGLLFAAAEVEFRDIPVAVMIDTGSARSFINPALADHLPTGNIALNMIGVGGVDTRYGLQEARGRLVRQLQIGGACFDRADVYESDLEIFTALGWDDRPAMIIGMDLLEGLLLRVDRVSGAIELSAQSARRSCRSGDRVQTRQTDPPA